MSRSSDQNITLSLHITRTHGHNKFDFELPYTYTSARGSISHGTSSRLKSKTFLPLGHESSHLLQR